MADLKAGVATNGGVVTAAILVIGASFRSGGESVRAMPATGWMSGTGPAIWRSPRQAALAGGT